VAEGVRATGSPLNGDADVAAVAGLIGEPARASLLLALAESPELSAGELAARAGIAEALAAIAPRRPVRSLREAHVGEALRRARTCYDHLAGRLGVELTAALARDGVVVDGEQPRLGPAAPERLDALGIDLSSLESGRRPLVRTCLDWSERRPHLAGAVGAALATRLFELGWIERRPANRSVAVTTRGRLALREEFGLDVDAFH
jgi:DNA-binding transcriptional ArsR family regulator